MFVVTVAKWTVFVLPCRCVASLTFLINYINKRYTSRKKKLVSPPSSSTSSSSLLRYFIENLCIIFSLFFFLSTLVALEANILWAESRSRVFRLSELWFIVQMRAAPMKSHTAFINLYMYFFLFSSPILIHAHTHTFECLE